MKLRHQLLPDGPRQRSYAGSALKYGWLDVLEEPAEPVLVTAQGLFMYFRRDQVHELIATTARRLSRASIVFDVVPEKMVQMLRRLPDQQARQATELWSWLFTAEERASISAIPGVSALHDLAPPLAAGLAPLVLSAVGLLPRRLRYSLPVFPILEATVESTSSDP